jgi:hypothetical protein
MSTEDAPDEGLLRRYLLGLTSADETERIDQLSVTSDDFANRLQAAEYDLVDAYAAGELSGELLDAFRATYPAHADGRAEIGFAETLAVHQARAARPSSASSPERTTAAPRKGWWQSDTLPRWTLALAATLVLAIAGYLIVENQSLRQDVDGARVERAALDAKARELQQQLAAQRQADAETARELERLRASLATVQQRNGGTGAAALPTVIASFVLPPATRGAGDITAITLPPGADVVRLQLPLEGTRFSVFSATLRDATTNQIVWRGGDLHPVAGRDKRTVTIAIPAGVLKPRPYLIELGGERTGGAPEPLSPYTFRVVIP